MRSSRRQPARSYPHHVAFGNPQIEIALGEFRRRISLRAGTEIHLEPRCLCFLWPFHQGFSVCCVLRFFLPCSSLNSSSCAFSSARGLILLRRGNIAVPGDVVFHEGNALPLHGVGDDGDGLSLNFLSLLKRPYRAAGSCPSHSSTCQPKAWNFSARGYMEGMISSVVPSSCSLL